MGGHKSSHNRKPGLVKQIECSNCLYSFNTPLKSSRKYCSSKCVYEHRRNLGGKRKLLMFNGDEINLTVSESRELRKNAINCDICGKKESHTRNDKIIALALDHDHYTKKFRGFLCSSCNRNLGWFENFEKSILSYLNN